MTHIRSLLLLLMLIASSSLCNAQTNRPIKNDYVRLGNVDSQYTTREQILSDPQLISLNKDCKVIGFSVSILPKGGDYVPSIIVSGSKFSNELVAAIKRYKGSAAICFEGIKLQCEQTIVNAPAIVLRVKYCY